MLHQYQSDRELKFPDQRLYTKPGDILMYNDLTFALTIYRNSVLMGTVQFSRSGLQEFLRLGWVKKPTEINSLPNLPVPPVPSYIVGMDLGFGEDKSVVVTATQTPEGDIKIVDITEVKGIPDSMLPLVPGITPEDRVVETADIPKPRKAKKS